MRPGFLFLIILFTGHKSVQFQFPKHAVFSATQGKVRNKDKIKSCHISWHTVHIDVPVQFVFYQDFYVKVSAYYVIWDRRRALAEKKLAFFFYVKAF